MGGPGSWCRPARPAAGTTERSSRDSPGYGASRRSYLLASIGIRLDMYGNVPQPCGAAAAGTPLHRPPEGQFKRVPDQDKRGNHERLPDRLDPRALVAAAPPDDHDSRGHRDHVQDRDREDQATADG